METRKGARSMAEIPSHVLEGINKGEIETLSLVEILAADQAKIIASVFGPTAFNWLVEPCRQVLSADLKPTFTQKMKGVGLVLAQQLPPKNLEKACLDSFRAAKSDVIRSYLAFLVGLHPNWSTEKKLQEIKSFADDSNAGVREFAWMAIRDHFMLHPDDSLELLKPWVLHDSANIRRFASEVTRPRGVWCKQWDLLKKEPELALPLLEPLCNDPDKYVQNSVANWLNDASKSKPDFVVYTTQQWLEKYPESKSTAYIAKRALRTLAKK